jgi:CheY-like chemotaxis protein
MYTSDDFVILLVEDGPDDIWAFRRAFHTLPNYYVLQVVESGDDAISYLKGTGPFSNRDEYPLPSVVLLDLKLPGTNGLDVLGWIRRQPELQSLRVIVLTSSDDLRDVTRAYQMGANSFLTKPLEFMELQEMLKAVGRFWLELSRRPTAERPAPSAEQKPTEAEGKKANPIRHR